MVIRNSLRYISAIILDHSLIYASKFLSGRVKGLITNLYLLTNRKLLSVSLIYNVIRSDAYYSRTLFLGFTLGL